MYNNSVPMNIRNRKRDAVLLKKRNVWYYGIPCRMMQTCWDSGVSDRGADIGEEVMPVLEKFKIREWYTAGSIAFYKKVQGVQ